MDPLQKPLRVLGLFQGAGIELEYMIVHRDSLNVLPITDRLLDAVAGGGATDFGQPDISWSNEMSLHVLELKNTDPVTPFPVLNSVFHRDVLRIDGILKIWEARLMPTGAHPWMDPRKESRLWPHEGKEIYNSLDRIFDSRRHGWANLQSVQLNLPFSNEEEFGRLHAAIRLVLPLIPALAASSPLLEGKKQKFLDHRLESYRTNCRKIPSLTGKVIPEPVFSMKEYQELILETAYRDIAPFDPDGILQYEWINARGTICRFDRYAFEIRVIDSQECPLMDLAVCRLILETVKALTEEKWVGIAELKTWETDRLAEILRDTMEKGENAPIRNREYLEVFGIGEERSFTAGEVWRHLYETVLAGNRESAELFSAPLRMILERGTLATRILKALNGGSDRDTLKHLYGELCDCLEQNRPFDP